MGRLTDLRKNLETRYTLESLEVLCADVDVPWESLGGDTLPRRALALVQFLDNQGRLPDLIAQVRKDFPEVIWALPPAAKSGEADDDDLPDGGTKVNIGPVSGEGQVNIGGVADVKNNTGQVSVGSRNVIQIGSLNVPRWLVIVLPVLVMAGLVIAGLGTIRTFSISQPTPTPVIGPAHMSGTFNVAVAQFPETDIDGRQTQTDDGNRVSRWVFDNLAKELADVPGTQVWHDSLPLAEKGASIGIITGTTASERQATAKEVADRIGAQLVIYGNFKKGTDKAELEPEFYVSTSAISLTKETEADAVLGSYKLGGPVGISLPFKAESSLLAEDTLQGRATFVRGVLYDLIGLHDKALADFRSVAQDWKLQGGQNEAVVEYFLGREALFLLRDPVKAVQVFGSMQQAQQQAENNFKASIAASSDFPLGHWGLGTTYLKQSEDIIAEGNITMTEFISAVATLGSAIGEYQTAVKLVDATSQPVLAARVHTSLANGMRLDAAAKLQQEDYPAALKRLDEAIAEASKALPIVEGKHARATASVYEVLGTSYLDQGGIYKLALGDAQKGNALLEQSRDNYQACMSVYDDLERKLTVDKLLLDFQANSCKPKLDAVEEELKQP